MDAPLRIAFLSNANSLHLREWAEFLAEELGQRVTVLTIPPLERPYRDTVRVVQLGHALTRRKPFWPLLVPRLRRELRRARADVLVAYRVVSYGFLAALTRFRPLVLAAQGGDMVWPPGRRIGEFCVRYATRRADLFNAWAENMRDEMMRYGADPARIVVLSRGIDLARFPVVTARERSPRRIAITRALLPSYNHRQLIAALPIVRQRVPDVLCEIAGEGRMRPALEQQARELGLDACVRFLGRLPHEEIPGLVGRAHVYCSTCITDGLPLSHIEAMAAGAVPVLVDIAPNRLWVRQGENGCLAPVGDADELGHRLADVLLDDALRERAIAVNRATVERLHDRRRNLPAMLDGWRRLLPLTGASDPILVMKPM